MLDTLFRHPGRQQGANLLQVRLPEGIGARAQCRVEGQILVQRKGEFNPVVQPFEELRILPLAFDSRPIRLALDGCLGGRGLQGGTTQCQAQYEGMAQAG
ncbi:MAG: hypothetical protein EBS11_10725 [Janthinobacterium sp.]|nr:hypothetical protein [Janthinobacterium sp.]